MESRYLAAIAVLVLLVASVPADAQTGSFVTEVASGDSDANRQGSTVQVSISYVDADGDGSPDVSDPDETVYFVFGGDNRVDFGDIRLTRFLTYPSGTAVNYTNRDVDLPTTEISGWFAQDSQGNWYVDVNDNGQVNVGDLAIEPGQGIEKVRPGSSAAGTSLQQVQSSFTPAERFIFVDEGPQGPDWGDRFYVDLDGNQQPNVGELRFQAERLGIDDNPTGREFQAAIDRLEQTDQELQQGQEDLRSELVQNDQEQQSRIDSLEAELAQTRADLETKDNWLMALGIIDLIAVAGVGYWVYSHRHDSETGDE